jgi:sec-independent protein translocase protein TatB|tara:strand:- start:64 stop:288 length:225 start_codon:yes stop_codon:yes gene_type:complete
MPTIGWFEILIVVAVSIIVIGPKDFPFMLRKVGSWVGTIKKYISDVQNEVSLMDEKIDKNIDTEEIRKDINKND